MRDQDIISLFNASEVAGQLGNRQKEGKQIPLTFPFTPSHRARRTFHQSMDVGLPSFRRDNISHASKECKAAVLRIMNMCLRYFHRSFCVC
jgi:hypothetical protein